LCELIFFCQRGGLRCPDNRYGNPLHLAKYSACFKTVANTFPGHFVRSDNSYFDCVFAPSSFLIRVKDGMIDVITDNINITREFLLEEFTNMGRIGNLDCWQTVNRFYPRFLFLRKTGGMSLIPSAIMDASTFL
jgi:hypothetical protein